jgi:hypothetical protein
VHNKVMTKEFTLIVEHFVSEGFVGTESSQQVFVGQDLVGLVVF